MCSLVNTCFITSIGQGEPAMTPEKHIQEIRTNSLPRPPFSAFNVIVWRYLNNKYQFSTITEHRISQPADSWLKIKNTQLES